MYLTNGLIALINMKIFKKLLIGLLVLLTATIVFLFIISPGKTKPITDEKGRRVPNSVAVIERPLIGGLQQGLIIRGYDKNNPVLLFLHGGPGVPSYSSVHEDLQGLEKLFTICYWEQRGAGMSFSGKLNPASMSIGQLVEDAAEVTRYLMKKFNKPKIYIMGHSWGTFLGSFTVHKYPELYSAYIGIGQLANAYLSEQESFAFVRAEAAKRKDKNAIADLEKLTLPSKTATGKEWWDYFQVQRKYVYEYGGSLYGKSRSAFALKKAILFCREYTLMDKINFARGINFSQTNLDSQYMNTDLNVSLPEQKIPVYIFQGLYDQQTTYSSAKTYFDHLLAPEKHFYTFTHSAHLPHIQEYAFFEKIVKEELLGQRTPE